ncbi:hypothetical protein [Lactobacillus iners]|jgi:hypothetical protein|uniref:Uncharacterized protein n=1 Tax=Lactobacillus iners LactinV 01V1-a TaxID=879297 RepID=E1NT89_9LACO|nr:hypothetical protein [Lactobacillus iners]EFO70672.1 hypothetical protein HMPREF9211_0029 [Lactobacillus iners LactinV 01V1-a]MCT7824442.1 hypothetical protein [Lactobacillus crispatus]EFQ50732.1 hypothetical protein HMPREF9218_1250 [Lactobacillus iners LEAF 2062A-h1]EGG32051.1 hypothetical protein HMPREF9210_0289 [Lactobacillus iners SPIN 1401G]MCT7684280.1 hypothetical protein [Lactobacillus iners]
MEDNKKTIVLKFNTEEHTIDMNFSPDLTDEMEIGYILSSSFLSFAAHQGVSKEVLHDIIDNQYSEFLSQNNED